MEKQISKIQFNDFDKLYRHVFSTYNNLRIGIAILGLLLPLVLYIVGKIQGIDLQNSISAYFHAEEGGYILRTLFVGILIIIGVVLIMYEGYSRKENIALNFAGIFAIGVALFPMSWDSKNDNYDFPGIDLFNLEIFKISLHGFFAIAFFSCVAYVCFRCQDDTLELIKDSKKRLHYKNKYRIIGALMLILPVVAACTSVLTKDTSSIVFWVEVVAIVVFAFYWLEKSKEIETTNYGFFWAIELFEKIADKIRRKEKE